MQRAKYTPGVMHVIFWQKVFCLFCLGVYHWHENCMANLVAQIGQISIRSHPVRQSGQQVTSLISVVRRRVGHNTQDV